MKNRLVICFFQLMTLSAFSASTIDSLMIEYDQSLLHAQEYCQQREARIDSLKALPTSASNMFAIGTEYTPYQCDSALRYFSMASELEEEPISTLSKLKLIYLLASIGYYSEGFEEKQSLHRDTIEKYHLLDDYYNAIDHLYGEAAVYSKINRHQQYYFHLSALHRDSLFFQMSMQTPTADYYKMLLIKARNEKRYDQALLYSDSTLMLTDQNSRSFAIMAYERAIIYRDMGDNRAFEEWLIRSAITDVRSGITDNGSSWMLAEMMYHNGDLERAHHYIEYSLANAGFFNARLRYMQINPLGNLINTTYQHQQSVLSRRLSIALLSIGALLVCLLLILLYTIRQYKHLHSLNKHLHSLNNQLAEMNQQLTALNASLEESNIVKEQYICRYLEVYRDYISRITKLARKAGEKDPDAIMKREMAEFYRQFDHTFLSLYRNFVTDFNALLVPEQRIYPQPGEGLTTELRIFALIRLGITSSTKIAELLCYSPNTIYNYRAKVKNASLGERDTFELRVAEL